MCAMAMREPTFFILTAALDRLREEGLLSVEREEWCRCCCC
jgi:hypothetical protein